MWIPARVTEMKWGVGLQTQLCAAPRTPVPPSAGPESPRRTFLPDKGRNSTSALAFGGPSDGTRTGLSLPHPFSTTLFVIAALKGAFLFFWPCHKACGILVPQPGTEPRLSAVKVLSPNDWTARECPWDTGFSFLVETV